MLWVNLIMDTLASLALATEPPTDELLRRKPHDRHQYIISKMMKKHIVGQALYQFTVILTLIFTADSWIPEYLPKEEIQGHSGELKYYSQSGYMRSGRSYMVPSGEEDYKRFEPALGPSRHYTLVFNTFVFLQVFNFLNCRKIQDETNIFKGILNNLFFVTIVSSIAILQLILGNFGGLPLSVSFHGLDWRQWLIAIAFGSGCLLWSFILKMIPTKAETPKKKTEMTTRATVEVSIEEIETDYGKDKNKMMEKLPMIAFDEIKNKPKMQKAISLDRSRNDKELSIVQARA